MRLLDPEVAIDVGQTAFAALPRPGRGRADRALAFERERFLPGLLAVDDATLASFGIESRVPLLDPVVASLADAVPLSEKSPPSAPRRLLRSALGTALPLAAARRRDKMGFPMPLAVWLSTPPWREYALDRIKSTSLERFGFDGRKVRAALEGQLLSPRTCWFLLALDALDGLLASPKP
jgi:asparagine synthase (glutamine-hydrolysing)